MLIDIMKKRLVDLVIADAMPKLTAYADAAVARAGEENMNLADAAVSEAVQSLKADIHNLKDQMDDIEDDVRDVKMDLEDLRDSDNGVGDLPDDVEYLKEELMELQDNFTTLMKKMERVKEVLEN